jgi:hypothetical protein
MSKKPKAERVVAFRYPYVRVQDYDGMPVYTVPSPHPDGRFSFKLLLIGCGIIAAAFALMVVISKIGGSDGWQMAVILAGLSIGGMVIFIAFDPGHVYLRFDSRDLSLWVDDERYDLRDIEAFTVEPHPRANSPKTQKFRHRVCVFAHSGPMAVNKIMLAEVKNNDEKGQAPAVRAAVDWCSHQIWDAHRQADHAPVPETTNEKPKDEGDWPLSG